MEFSVNAAWTNDHINEKKLNWTLVHTIVQNYKTVRKQYIYNIWVESKLRVYECLQDICYKPSGYKYIGYKEKFFFNQVGEKWTITKYSWLYLNWELFFFKRQSLMKDKPQ